MSTEIEIEEKLYNALKKRAKAKKMTIMEYVSSLAALTHKDNG